jgi:hypothetical protein
MVAESKKHTGKSGKVIVLYVPDASNNIEGDPCKY